MIYPEAPDLDGLEYMNIMIPVEMAELDEEKMTKVIHRLDELGIKIERLQGRNIYARAWRSRLERLFNVKVKVNSLPIERGIDYKSESLIGTPTVPKELADLGVTDVVFKKSK